MGQHYLDRLFSPRSIAVIGASNRLESVGGRVLANLHEADYRGELHPVNPNRDEVQGMPALPTVEAIGKPVDLAVIATPAPTVPDLIRQCGEQGVSAAVVLSAGFGETGEAGARLERKLVDYARRYGVRLLGPNCLGIMRPALGLNATFSRNMTEAGHLALVSQSGAICTAILDWAQTHHVGFSAVVSMGDAADVDFGDVLDYLALDAQTRSILLYVEGIHNARSFVSGLRIAARLKPVVVVKSGRHAEGTRAARSHTGALIGGDDVFDAALRRAGVVRAFTISQLFSAAQILASDERTQGNRLAIVTNAGGPGVMATDRAVEVGVELADLGPATVERLDAALPPHWSHGNPVDILGDATPERYRQAVAACLDDRQVDGVLAMLTPQAMTDPLAAAQALCETKQGQRKPVLACWMGAEQVREARARFAEQQLPAFTTPEASVEAFSYLSTYQRNQQLLLQVPGSLASRQPVDVEGARLIIEGALGEGRQLLTAMEAKAVLHAFGVNTVSTMLARSAAEALVLAESLGFPVAMKIESPDIPHKTDVDGVRLNIASAQAVRSTYRELTEQARRRRPGARIEGVTLEPMQATPHRRELLVGVVRDPVFGPVISFGAGGTIIEVLRDRAVALPPLNRFIAADVIQGTRIAALLGQFRNMPPVAMEKLEAVLLRVSDMVCELPHIQEMDINPLIANAEDAVAVDVRMSVALPAPSPDPYAHMAIYPYPAYLVTRWQLADGSNITVRPIRPEDAGIEQEFVRRLSPQSKYFRFRQSLHELTPAMLVRFTQIDYHREMALIAVYEEDGREVEVGVARYTVNPDGTSCEFALVVSDEWQNRGIGSRLMLNLMEEAKARGLKTMEGEVQTANRNMLSMVEHLGFSVRVNEDDPTVHSVHKRL